MKHFRRGLALLFAPLLLAGAPPPKSTALPASPSLEERVRAAAPFWEMKGSRLQHVPTGTTVPLRFGNFELHSIGISSHHGTGLDDSLEWRTDGRESFATAFVFRPTLNDAGLLAFITDEVIHRQYGPDVRSYDDRFVAAGGVPNAARRIRYTGMRFQERAMWTGAAVMKVGDWMLSLRLSGPIEKRTELEQALDLLIAGLTFGKKPQPHPFHRIEISDCSDRVADRAAQQSGQPMMDAMAVTIGLTALDGQSDVIDATGGKPTQLDLTRVPDKLCRSSVIVSGTPRPLLRPPAGVPAGLMALSQLLLLTDALDAVEVSRINKPGEPFHAIRHGIGTATIGAAIDGPLDVTQLTAVAAGNSPLVTGDVGYSVDAWGKTSIFVPADSKQSARDAPAPNR